jgi:short subunit dehydrogenase-like uncharacterized protein
MSRDFDIALFGASGFTGQPVAERLVDRVKTVPSLWVALAGRDLGEAAAKAIAAAVNELASDNGPKPGEGPSRAEREAGFYDLLFVGAGPNGERLDVGVKGDRDPGYGSTAKMIAECALELCEGEGPGGVLTPVAAFGVGFADRLARQAGLSFSVERG